MILKDTSTGNLLRTSGDSSDGESHADDDNDGDDCDNDNGRDAGRASVEVARVPALVSAISQGNSTCPDRVIECFAPVDTVRSEPAVEGNGCVG
jgi:hypothetical protein